MAVVAYKHYRLYVSKTASTSGYVTLNEFGMFAEADHSGVDLCIGATATADGSYAGGTLPANAIDGNPSTFWESSSGLTGHWLQVELPSAEAVRSIYIASLAYPNEVPIDFVFQGSHDAGATWTDILSIYGWATGAAVKSAYLPTSTYVGGVSTLDTGAPSTKILVHKWVDHSFVGAAYPDSEGNWSMSLLSRDELVVTHLGPSGYRPLCDGPITPQVD